MIYVHVFILWLLVLMLALSIGAIGTDLNQLKKQVNHIGERICGDLYTCTTPEGTPYP